jgi:hypothetical protein
MASRDRIRPAKECTCVHTKRERKKIVSTPSSTLPTDAMRCQVVTQTPTNTETNAGKYHFGAQSWFVVVGVLVDEIVHGHQCLFQTLLIDLEAVSRHFVVAYADDTAGAHARAFLVPSTSDFPSLTGLCEWRTRISNVPTFAQDCEGIEDVEEYATHTRQSDLETIQAVSSHNVPLGKLQVMIPTIRHSTEAVPLCHDIQEYEQRLFDTYVGSDL